MVLHSRLAAEALFVIIKHKSISSFEIYNSDFGVKLAMALCYSIKQQPTGAWTYTKRCYRSLFSRILGQPQKILSADKILKL